MLSIYRLAEPYRKVHMEKSAAFIIATAIVVAGLIVAAAVLGTQKTGRYVPWTEGGTTMTTLDTQTGTLWAWSVTGGRGDWRSFPLP